MYDTTSRRLVHAPARAAIELLVAAACRARSGTRAASAQVSSLSLLRLLRSLLPNWTQAKHAVASGVGAALKRTAGAACGSVPAFGMLLVEGAEADDVAAYLTRALVDNSSRHRGAVVLVSADGDWLQYLSRPRVHLLDVFGASLYLSSVQRLARLQLTVGG